MTRTILTRKTSGGRCCFFRGKSGGRMTTSRGKSDTKKPQDGVKEIMSQTHTPKPNAPIVMMESKTTPSNYEMKQSKKNMDNFTKKLGSVKLSQPKNIAFSV